MTDWSELLPRGERVVKVSNLGPCLVWTGPKTEKGYGRFRGERVHRVTYRLKIGPIPEGRMVLHDCDVPPCFEPSHLYVGTAADNSADMVRRGRQNGPEGPRNGSAKLSREKVLRIRELYNDPTRPWGAMAVLERELGIDHSHMYKIATRQRWSCV